MKHCGYCGMEIPESAAFCPYCGKPQGRAAAGRTASAAKKYCGKCGKAIPAAARFCPYCGDRVGAAEAGAKRPEKPARPGKASRPPKKRRWIAAVAAVLVVCIGVGGFLWIKKLSSKGIGRDHILPSSENDHTYKHKAQDITHDPQSDFEFFNNTLLAYTIGALTDDQKASLAAQVDGKVVGELNGAVNLLQIQVEKASYDEMSQKIARLNRSENVLLSFFDAPFKGNVQAEPWSSNPTDPDTDLGNQSNPGGNDWWAEAIGAYDAWKYENTGGRIGMLDTGIDADHEEFYNKLYVLSSHPENPSGHHGTLVAGPISAKNNDAGLRGIFDTADIVTATWADENGKQVLGDMDIMDILKDMVEADIHVINNSWVTENGSSESAHNSGMEMLGLIIELMLNGKDDFIFVQGAGNTYNDTYYSGWFCAINRELYDEYIQQISESKNMHAQLQSISYESIIKHKMIVGGTDKNKNDSGEYYMTRFCYGKNIDICAPAVDIFTTENGGGYTLSSGTSLATPMVSASLGLITSVFPQIDACRAKEMLLKYASTAKGIESDEESVYKMLNIGNALAELEKIYVNDVYINVYAADSNREQKLTDCTLSIVSERTGELYVQDNRIDSPQSDKPRPLPKDWQSAYHIALPVGKYTVSITVGDTIRVYADILDSRENFNINPADEISGVTMWAFDWKDKVKSSTASSTPPPQKTPMPTKKPDGGKVNYAAIFRAKMDELVDRYGAMAGEPQVKTVGREYNWAPIWTSHESEGMLFGDVFDYDSDGAPELLTMRNAPGQGDSNFFDMLFLEIYEVKDGACVLSDTANISAQGLSMGGWAGTGVSAFRYSLNGAPAIGVLCETDSGMDWVVATLSYGYTGEFLLMNNGVKYGSWPGASAEEGEEGGYLSACFEAVSERSALYTSANGDTFEHWKVVANSGQKFYDAQVNDVYWKYLGKIGLTPRSGGALSDRLLQEGPFLQQPVNDYIRYHSAADSLEALEGDLTMLGNITNEYFIESDIFFARDYLYEDMQEFIAVGNLATGSYDRQAQPSQPTLMPVELPPVPHFDNEPAEPTRKPEASADDSEKALRKKVLEAYSGSGDIQAFGYSDFDWDGRHEAFALIGVYNDSTWENTCELWFVSPDTCTRLEEDKGYYPYESAIVTEGGYACFTVSEGYFGSGSTLRLWTVLDGQPVPHSQREYAGQSGEISREVYLEDRDSGGDADSDDTGHGGTVKVREASLRSNVRTGPGLGYDTIGELTGSTELEFLNETSIDDRGVTWYKVRFKGRDGWVSEKYTKLTTH